MFSIYIGINHVFLFFKIYILLYLLLFSLTAAETAWCVTFAWGLMDFFGGDFLHWLIFGGSNNVKMVKELNSTSIFLHLVLSKSIIKSVQIFTIIKHARNGGYVKFVNDCWQISISPSEIVLSVNQCVYVCTTVIIWHSGCCSCDLKYQENPTKYVS